VSASASGAGYAVLITGGAGFIGTNLAARLMERGEEVRIFDSLDRAGSESNLAWLRQCYGEQMRFIQGDVRDTSALNTALHGIEHVVHLAAQVAVTSSLTSPAFDFDVNAFGTLNLLEALRRCPQAPSLLFTSTNKVYGTLDDMMLEAGASRYTPVDRHERLCGINEQWPLDFHSPYGCSKGAADQYVLDYSRSYGLRTAVFRMSCIYGPHQFGNEDQGWVAHMARNALGGGQITVYGDGMQVRDVLFVDDLLDAFDCARRAMPALSGRAFNIGGGPANTTSVLELIGRLETQLDHPIDVSYGEWRMGDQRYYVSDTSRFRAATGWQPRVSVEEGIANLCEWLRTSAPLAFRPSEPTTAAMQLSGATK
jgi:CDP-paratose 2-epimerase